MVQQMVYEVTGYWNEHGVDIAVPTVRDDGRCSTGHQVRDATTCTTEEISFVLNEIQNERDTIGNLAV